MATDRTISGTYLVKSGGRIAVNVVGRIGKMSDAANPTSLALPFDVALARTACLPSASITVERGGRIDVGGRDRIGTLSMNRNSAITLSGGRLTVVPGSRLLIGDDATLTIGAASVAEISGELLLQGNGRIVVENGGYLRVKGEGLVQATNAGRIVLEAGGILQLTDPGQTRGRATLRIATGGVLEVDGAHKFSGNGRLELLRYSAVEANAPLKLKGTGTDGTAVMVYDDPEVRGAGGLDFEALSVIYTGQSTLRMTDARASLRLRDVAVSRSDNDPNDQPRAFRGTSLRSVNVSNSTFTSFYAGLEFVGSVVPNSPSTYTFVGSTFQNCNRGISIATGGTLSVRSTTFKQTAGGNGRQAIDVRDMRTLTLTDVSVSKHASSGLGTALNSAAVRSTGATAITVSGGRYDDNYTALGFQGASTVRVFGCAQFYSNRHAIYGEGSASAGVLNVTGAAFAYNTTAVFGHDLELSVSGTDFLHASGSGNPLLSLAYAQRPLPTSSSSLRLSQNYWNKPPSQRVGWIVLRRYNGQTSQSYTTAPESREYLCFTLTVPTTPGPTGASAQGSQASTTWQPQGNVVVYPNPVTANTTANAAFDNFAPVDVSVYDAAGQRVRQVAYPGDAVWPLGDGWTPGRYEVVATDANGHVLSAALIAQ